MAGWAGNEGNLLHLLVRMLLTTVVVILTLGLLGEVNGQLLHPLTLGNPFSNTTVPSQPLLATLKGPFTQGTMLHVTVTLDEAYNLTALDGGALLQVVVSQLTPLQSSAFELPYRSQLFSLDQENVFPQSSDCIYPYFIKTVCINSASTDVGFTVISSTQTPVAFTITVDLFDPQLLLNDVVEGNVTVAQPLFYYFYVNTTEIPSDQTYLIKVESNTLSALGASLEFNTCDAGSEIGGTSDVYGVQTFSERGVISVNWNEQPALQDGYFFVHLYLIPQNSSECEISKNVTLHRYLSLPIHDYTQPVGTLVAITLASTLIYVVFWGINTAVTKRDELSTFTFVTRQGINKAASSPSAMHTGSSRPPSTAPPSGKGSDVSLEPLGHARTHSAENPKISPALSGRDSDVYVSLGLEPVVHSRAHSTDKPRTSTSGGGGQPLEHSSSSTPGDHHAPSGDDGHDADHHPKAEAHAAAPEAGGHDLSAAHTGGDAHGGKPKISDKEYEARAAEVALASGATLSAHQQVAHPARIPLTKLWIDPTLTVEDMDTQGYGEQVKRGYRYLAVATVVSLFYALLAGQFVVGYLDNFLNGERDLCAHNYYCANSYGNIRSFNNFISNLAFIIFGLALFCIAQFFSWRFYFQAERIFKQKNTYDGDPFEIRAFIAKAKAVGVAKTIYTYYAVAFLLFTEGIFSALYHLCPNSDLFQFDTTFMYAITILLIVNIFEKRHADITPDPAVVFGLIGVCVLFTAIHDYASDSEFWVAFLVVDVILCVCIALYVMLSGNPFRWENYPTWAKLKANKPWFLFVTFLLLVHFVILIIAVVLEPDFATFVLGILVLNFLLYLGYYMLMKVIFDKDGERRVIWKPAILFTITLVLAVVAIYFFALPTSDKNQLPMLSRNLNTDCVFMDFYDTHDVWHFFAGAGLFSAAISLLYLDVDLTDVAESKIKSF